MHYKDRYHFLEIINRYALKTGVEVGVREGNYAREILKTSIHKLIGIDIKILPSAQRLEAYYGDRYSLIQGQSPTIAEDFPDNFFDFVYIDAGHTYEQVRDDIAAWWPKCKRGGVFAGDDYVDFHSPSEGKYGVIEAVDELVEAENLQLCLTGIDEGATAEEKRQMVALKSRNKEFSPLLRPTWYVIKT